MVVMTITTTTVITAPQENAGASRMPRSSGDA